MKNPDNMSRNERIEEIGRIGEMICRSYLQEEYGSASLSEDKYDRFKDIVADNGKEKINAEIKVRSIVQRGQYQGHIPLETSQCPKIDNAKRALIVNNPMSRDERVRIYEIVDKTAYTYDKQWGNGAGCRLYPVAAMKILKEIEDPKIIDRLYQLNPSQYKQ